MAISKRIDMSDWIHGETGGYLRCCTVSRNWFEQDFPKFKTCLPMRSLSLSRENNHNGDDNYVHHKRVIEAGQGLAYSRPFQLGSEEGPAYKLRVQ